MGARRSERTLVRVGSEEAFNRVSVGEGRGGEGGIGLDTEFTFEEERVVPRPSYYIA